MLVAGVPQSRGTPVHIEHPDFWSEGSTDYGRDGKITRITTPRGNTLVRIHELMHARHTDKRRYQRTFGGFHDVIGQVLEDCRLHLLHWPWGTLATPEPIRQAVTFYLERETEMINEALTEDPTRRGSFGDFATRLRRVAVQVRPFTEVLRYCIDNAGFAPGQEKLARVILVKLLANKQTKDKEAARLIEAAFFPKPPPLPFAFAGGAGPGCNPNPDPNVKIISVNGYQQPSMEIIELPLTEPVEGASIGERRATMGSRIYRPALRRPLLPQRMFIRRTPREPGGTILIDASGSMGDMENIQRWLAHAPFGQIAYYAGNGTSGWLWIYAKDGRKAAEAPQPDSRGNTVDGPALTWLMQQPAPRIMVTDRGFCDCSDSTAQVARLAQLEGAGEVVVKNYNNTDDYDPDA
jgi:hypothetical protein